MSWVLSEPCRGVEIEIDTKGVWLKGRDIDLNDYAQLKGMEPCNRLGRLLPSLIPQLIQLGVAQSDGKYILIKYNDFVSLEGSEIDAFDDLVPWSPFAIELETESSLGLSDFHYDVRFHWGQKQIYVDRIGCFVKRAEKIYRLEQQMFALLDAVGRFNSLTASEKTKSDVFLKFSEIKGISEDVGAQIDRYMLKEKVIVPAKIDLDLVEEKDGRISFVPKIDRVPDESLFHVFMASDDADEIYAIQDEHGGRIRVIFDDSQKEVLRRMRKVRHLSGIDKAKVLRNPYEVFDGVANSVNIDLTKYGPRVKGVGDFPFVSIPFIKYEVGGFFGPEDNSQSAGNGSKKFNAGINCRYADGTEEKVYFDNKKELLDFYHQTKLAWDTGQQTVDLKGKTIVVDKCFVDGADALAKRVTRPPKEHGHVPAETAYLLIYTNEEELEYREDEDVGQIDDSMLPLPLALIDESTLKQYQRDGIKWLQMNYLLNGRKGCLLADEMGLGKTFQVLVFLAWLIEKGGISPSTTNNFEIPPWNPILIIAPVMLLENESWQKDMKKFFKYEGDIFQPYLLLHGAELRRRRRPQVKGRETELRESVLDLEGLRKYRVILTGYETVVNYQFSFAMMKDAWTVIVTDEAQEYKTANTKISHALKSLAPRIRIACTGTPVETKLMDLWNIMDFLQPGALGSASSFARTYERPIIELPEKRDEILADLKRRLHFCEPHAYVLRREKQSILHELPIKHEYKEYCNLSTEQRERHIDFIGQVHKGAHPLSILPLLMKLHQHPNLLPEYSWHGGDEALEKSPKLKRVMEILNNIRTKREKVLIFTRSLNMQQLLSAVISEKFGLNVDMINGTVPRGGGSKSGAITRSEGIRRFSESEGFNVLIASPDVAGVGLTIIEANHVIHYGRWWNPAKEMQATDRVYRIGQEKDVHVYYPIARDSNGDILSFDERLDKLLERRKELARDFLAPMPEDGDNKNELIKDLIGEDFADISKPLSQTDIMALPWDRFESLIALLEEKNGRTVILTPKSIDYGVDVLSFAEGNVFLIQCKHTNWGSSCDSDTISEMLAAFDNYKLRWLRNMKNMVLRPVLVTNGSLTKSAHYLAKDNDVSYMDFTHIIAALNKNTCSFAEIEVMENKRKTSMREVSDEIRSLF